MRLLLGSGGIGTPERAQAWKESLDSFLGEIDELLFVPFAVRDHDRITTLIEERGFSAGRKVKGIHSYPDPQKAVREAQAIYVGGGNSFRLLNDLYRLNLVEEIKQRIHSGVPYVGVSAGSNVASPTMQTTNDMPIVYPPSFDAFGFIPFQINPHYTDGRSYMKDGEKYVPYYGETRDDRLREFHEMNETSILGLAEGTVLRCENGYHLEGVGLARFFQKGKDPVTWSAPTNLTDFLN